MRRYTNERPFDFPYVSRTASKLRSESERPNLNFATLLELASEAVSVTEGARLVLNLWKSNVGFVLTVRWLYQDDHVVNNRRIWIQSLNGVPIPHIPVPKPQANQSSSLSYIRALRCKTRAKSSCEGMSHGLWAYALDEFKRRRRDAKGPCAPRASQFVSPINARVCHHVLLSACKRTISTRI